MIHYTILPYTYEKIQEFDAYKILTERTLLLNETVRRPHCFVNLREMYPNMKIKLIITYKSHPEKEIVLILMFQLS